jgi:hypothetical protein
MKREGRNETNHAAGVAPRGFYQGVVHTNISVRESVEPSCYLNEFTLPNHPAKGGTRIVGIPDILGAKDRLRTGGM